MSRLVITPDAAEYEVLDSSDLTPAERERFDYLDWAKLDAGSDSASFIRRDNGEVYDLGEFMRVDPGGELHTAGWHGIASDSFSSGMILRFTDSSCESVTLARYYLAD